MGHNQSLRDFCIIVIFIHITFLLFFAETEQEVSFHQNFDLQTIVMPLNVAQFDRLLRRANYDPIEVDYLVNGFKYGFDIGYTGSMTRQDRSKNIPFKDGVGNAFIMWEKIMKEVKAGRYAGPFTKMPFRYFVQTIKQD